MNKYINLKLALNKLWGLCEEDIEAEIPEAFDFSRAREALYDLPTIEVSEDCISRADLIKVFLADNECDTREEAKACMCSLDLMLELIEDAPSVVPKTQIETQNSNENSDVISVSDGVSEMIRCAIAERR